MEEAFYGLFRFFRSLAAPAGVALALAFTTPAVHRENGNLVVEGVLEGAITESVHSVLDTGTPVEIRYQGRLQAADRVLNSVDSATLRHDSLTGAFLVERGATHLSFPTLEEAAREATRYRLAFADPGKGPLDLEVEASLHHPRGLDLPGAAAALWDHRTPYLRIRNLERMVE